MLNDSLCKVLTTFQSWEFGMEQFLPLAAQIMMTILQREKYCIVQSREDDFGLREVDPQCRMEFCPQVKTHKHKGELQAVLQK